MLTDVLSMLAPQNRRLFKLNILTQTANDEFLLEHFSGTEELSKLYEFDLALLSQQSDVKLKSLIGSQATIEIELSNGSFRYINGYVQRFSTQGSDGGYVRYAAVLGPWLWMLTCRFDTRIFQEKSVQAVVSEVFAGFGTLAKYEFRVSKSLKSHSYITQYRESDFNFVQRLLESEGLFYYFEHTADSHLMVITDDSSTLLPLPEQPQIRYRNR